MTPAEIIELREQAGMTQQQLADALGLNRRTIYRYEIGEITIPFYKELALRQVLTGRSITVAKPAAKRSNPHK